MENVTVTELVYKLVADASSLKSGMKKADRDMQKMHMKAVEDWKRSNAKLSAAQKAEWAKLAGIQTTAQKKIERGWIALNAIILGVTTKMFKSVVKEASNALEANNKLRAVFSQMNDEAIAAAKSLSKYYGVSTVNARSMLADTGNILTNFGIAQDVALRMSEQINQLGVDLASFVNYQGGAAGAANALTKALLGEREAAKALGVAITENDIKNLAQLYDLPVSGLTRQQRALLTLQVMLRQTKNAQGDFARSSKDLENQTRILSAAFSDLKLSIGQEIIPYVIKVVGLTTKTVRSLTDMDEVSQFLILKLPALAIAVKSLAISWGLLNKALGMFSKNTLIGLGITALSVAIGALVNHMHRVKEAERDFTSAADDLAKATKNYNAAVAEQNRLLKENKDLQDESANMARFLADENVRITKAEMNLARVRAMNTYNANAAYVNANRGNVDVLNRGLDIYQGFSGMHGMSTRLARQTKEFSVIKAQLAVMEQEITNGDTSLLGVHDAIALLVRKIETKQGDVADYLDDFNETTLKQWEESVKEYGTSSRELQAAVDTLATVYFYDPKAWEEAQKTFKDSPDFIAAIDAAIVKLREDLTEGGGIAEELAKSQYITQDWLALLRDTERAIVDLDDAELERAGKFNELQEKKLSLLAEEKTQYLANLETRREVLREQARNDGHTDESVKAEGYDSLDKWLEDNSDEWLKLMEDEVNMETYYQEQSSYIVKYYTGERIKVYEDYEKQMEGIRDDLAETSEELYQVELKNMKKGYEDLQKNLISSSSISDKSLIDAMLGHLSDEDPSEYMATLSEEGQKLFTDLLDLRKTQLEDEEHLEKEHKKAITDINNEWDKKILGLGEDTLEKRKEQIEFERDLELAEAEKTGADKEKINKYYDGLIADEEQENTDRIAKLNQELSMRVMQAQEQTLTNKINLLRAQRKAETEEAEKTGADVAKIDAYYDALEEQAFDDAIQKLKDREKKKAELKKSSYRASMYGSGEGTITGTWIKGGTWQYEKADLEAQRDEELARYEKGSAKWEEASKRWGKRIGKAFADNIMESIKIGVDYIGQLLGGIEDIMDRFADNEQQVAENRLHELEELRDNDLKDAEDSGRKRTKEEKDEFERRQAMYAEEIKNQEALIKQQKEEAFKRQKAFDIAQATISGIKAAVDAYSAMADIPYVGPALGATAAATTAAFVGAQIAAIAMQPMPSYAVGAYNIPNDQVAQVHKGEAIIPRPFAEELRSGKTFGGGGDIQINVYGATEEVTVEEDKSNDNRRVLNVYMTNRIKQMVMNGELDAPLQTRYQLPRNGRRG